MNPNIVSLMSRKADSINDMQMGKLYIYLSFPCAKARNSQKSSIGFVITPVIRMMTIISVTSPAQSFIKGEEDEKPQ